MQKFLHGRGAGLMLAVLAGVAAGWLLGRRPAGPESAPMAADVQAPVMQTVPETPGQARREPEIAARATSGETALLKGFLEYVPVPQMQDIAWMVWRADDGRMTDSRGGVLLETLLGFLQRGDHEGALRWVLTLGVSEDRARLLKLLLNAWIRKDFDAARRAVEQLPGDRVRAYGFQCIVREWARRNPQGALAFYQTLGRSVFNSQILSELAGGWAEHDVQGALKWGEQLAGAGDRRQVLQQVIREWGRQDGRAALDYVMQSPPSLSQRQWISGLMAEWVPQDVRAAGAALEALPPTLRTMVFNQNVSYFAQADPVFTAEWIARLLPPGDMRNQAGASLMRLWARKDLAGALDWMRACQNPREQRVLFQTLVPMWVEDNPAQVESFIAGLESAAQKTAFQELWLQSWARADGEGALAWAEKNVPAEQRDSLLISLAHTLYGDDPQRAVILLKDVGESREKERALRNAVSRWAQYDIGAAVDWVSVLVDSPLKHSMLGMLAGQYATVDPLGSLEVMALIPEGPQQESALSSLMHSWTRYDPGEAGAFLQELPEGKLRDTAVSVYSGQIAAQFPEIAVVWARSISDVQVRSRQLEQVARIWMKADAERARPWTEAEVELTAEQKARIFGRSGPDIEVIRGSN